MEQKIYVLVATGGPCGGKTSLMAYLSDKFSDKGIKTYFVPETASILINAGIEPESPRFQSKVLRTIIHLEDEVIMAAKESGPGIKLIICDRGTMDGMAYCMRGEFENLIKELGMNIVELRD